MRKRAEVENSGKNEATGPRKPKDILGHKVSVKVSKDPGAAPHPSTPPRSILTKRPGGTGIFLPSVGTRGEVV